MNVRHKSRQPMSAAPCGRQECADHHCTLGTMTACTGWFRVEQIAREQCGGNVTNRKLHMHVHRIIIAVVLALVYRIRVSTIID